MEPDRNWILRIFRLLADPRTRCRVANNVNETDSVLWGSRFRKHLAVVWNDKAGVTQVTVLPNVLTPSRICHYFAYCVICYIKSSPPTSFCECLKNFILTAHTTDMRQRKTFNGPDCYLVQILWEWGRDVGDLTKTHIFLAAIKHGSPTC